MKLTLAEIRRANRDAGKHFFGRETMRFFRSRVYAGMYGGPDSPNTYFVTSEQFVPLSGPAESRMYTVRVARADGTCETFGEFQAYRTLAEARDAARKAARMDEVAKFIAELRL